MSFKFLYRRTFFPWPFRIFWSYAFRCLCTMGLYEAVRTPATIHQQTALISRDDLYGLVQKHTKEKDVLGGRQVHSLMIITELDSVSVLGDHLIRMFSSCESLLEASLVFCTILHPTIYTWNAIISSNVMHGQSERVFDLYYKMQVENVCPAKVTFLLLLKACANEQALLLGRLIHEELFQNSYDTDMRLCSAVIDMYGKCGSIEEGWKVFSLAPSRDVVMYNALITSYREQECVTCVPKLLGKMLGDGIHPTCSILISVLNSCSSIDAVRMTHYCITIQSLCLELMVVNVLMEMYVTFRALEEAYKVFAGLPMKNSATWSILMRGLIQYDQTDEALNLFMDMEKGDEKPNEFFFTRILKACASACDLNAGRFFHDQVLKSGFEFDEVIGCALVEMYVKSKNLEEAQRVLDASDSINEASSSALIRGYVLLGKSHSALKTFEKLQRKDIQMSRSIIFSGLKACADIGAIQSGRWIHDQISKLDLESEMDIASTLVDMYAKCGSIQEAFNIFNRMPQHDAVSMSAMIGAYADHGLGLSGLLLFQQMEQEEVKADKVTYACALRACGCSESIYHGRLMHHSVIKWGYESDIVIGSTLVDMYAKCGNLDEAHVTFCELQHQDVVAWGALIAGYIQQGLISIGFDLFDKMQREGINPSQSIYSSLLKACDAMESTFGMLLYAQVIEAGYDSDGVMVRCMIDMYSKSGNIDDASSVFHNSLHRDVLTWSAIIAGHVLCEEGFLAVNLFEKMQLDGIVPDKITCLFLLKACSMIGASGQGKLVHKRLIISGFEFDLECSSAIISMYAKCGCLDDAYRILVRQENPSVCVWGAIITCHANHGDNKLAQQFFTIMQKKGTKPDDIIFLNILTACSHAGLLEEGQFYLKSMGETYLILPEAKHYNCFIDLLGRAGRLSEAQDLLHCIPRTPDIVGWLSLLSGCKTYDNKDIGMQCYDAVVTSNQHDASSYTLMSNIYSSGRMDGEVDK